MLQINIQTYIHTYNNSKSSLLQKIYVSDVVVVILFSLISFISFVVLCCVDVMVGCLLLLGKSIPFTQKRSKLMNENVYKQQ